MSSKPLFVRAEWDDEASVWVATSEDVPGLATEEETIEPVDSTVGKCSQIRMGV